MLFKKILAISLILVLSACGGGAPDAQDTSNEISYEGKGEGYGGELVVKVTKADDKITNVEVVSNSETPDIAGDALVQIPKAIVEANGTTVDVVSGATFTSNAIIYAVNNALDTDNSYPYPIVEEEKEQKEQKEITADTIFQGLGYDNSIRIGPGKDNEDVQVYSINQIFANALFDNDGKILALYVDQLEVASPNTSSETMPRFSGWPGQIGYNTDVDFDKVIDGKIDPTEENFLEEISKWTTKRERGDEYKLGMSTWAEQMDTYQEFFVGMTVDEVEMWYEKYCSDNNGRPLKEGSEAPEDADKYANLSDDEKDMLADVVSGATMSLNDSHGNIVAAIKDAYSNKNQIEASNISSLGLGFDTVGRIQKEDSEGVKQYSFNVVVSATAFDENHNIANLFLDQYEITTPNSSSKSAPHISGFPGQGGYNYDENHESVITSKTPDTEEFLLSETDTWVTKRDREDYKMTSGTWAEQMDTYQSIFNGMSIEEVNEWYENYTSDKNGRPLKSDSEEDVDIEKYEALTDDEKDMLADVVTSASISLNDDHGNLIDAISNSNIYKTAVLINAN